MKNCSTSGSAFCPLGISVRIYACKYIYLYTYMRVCVIHDNISIYYIHIRARDTTLSRICTQKLKCFLCPTCLSFSKTRPLLAPNRWGVQLPSALHLWGVRLPVLGNPRATNNNMIDAVPWDFSKVWSPCSTSSNKKRTLSSTSTTSLCTKLTVNSPPSLLQWMTSGSKKNK